MQSLILLILGLNLLVVFLIRSNTKIIIFTMISGLMTILLYSTTIDNFLIVKKLVTYTIIYLVAILFLATNNSSNSLDISTRYKSSTFLFVLLSSICLLSSLYIANNINQKLISDKKHQQERQNLYQHNSDNKKFSYLKNTNIKNNFIFSKFNDFIIVICCLISILFIKINHQKE